ncbi:hypothetical protein HDU97_002130 [Phlyctochytrium planicorne]|nr:hypothetical protein HDU97_002130 [Phlyctochytrium planicorne]
MSNHKYSPLTKPVAALLARLPLKPIFQRIPGILCITVILFGFFGPAYAPYAFSFYYLLLNCMFMVSNVRTAYGVTTVKKLAKESSYTDWVQKYCDKVGATDGYDTGLRGDLAIEHVMHVIIVPNYKEGMDTLCETLDILASHAIAPTNYKVCLAMEENEAEGESKAQSLVRLYADHFYDIVYTIHPKDIPGEIRGKSTNVSWAARQMVRMSKDIRSEVMTVMDADTAFAADYFMSVAYYYATATPEERRLQMFAPCTVFDRNSKEVPAVVRQTDVMWSLAVMSNLYPESLINFPCSAYSLSMELCEAVGFWDCGPEGIGEDMHMYLKVFFSTEGRVVIRPIYSPASQCNIEGDGYVGGMMARYTQGKRHMWGGLDIGYCMRRILYASFAPSLDHTIPRDGERKGKKVDGKDAEDDDTSVLSPMLTINLMYRQLEAHVTVAHMFLLMMMIGILVPTGSDPNPIAVFWWESITTESIHPILQWSIDVCGWLRFLGLFPMLMSVRSYEAYHHWVGVERWRLSALGSNQVGPRRVQPLGRRAQLLSVRNAWNLLDWVCLPLTGLFYHTAPQMHAQISHIFTDRLDYKVAAKPVLNRGGEEVPLNAAHVESTVVAAPVSPSVEFGARRVELDMGFDGITVESEGEGEEDYNRYHSYTSGSLGLPALTHSGHHHHHTQHHHTSSISSSISNATTAVTGGGEASPSMSARRWISSLVEEKGMRIHINGNASDDALDHQIPLRDTNPNAGGTSMAQRSPSVASSSTAATLWQDDAESVASSTFSNSRGDSGYFEYDEAAVLNGKDAGSKGIVGEKRVGGVVPAHVVASAVAAQQGRNIVV